MINKTEYLNKIEEKCFRGSRPFELRPNAVTLIFGLGGTGIRYAAAVKELFLKRYGERTVRERVKFLCLDTSQEELDNKQIFTDNEKIIINGFAKYDWLSGRLSDDVKKSNFGGGGGGAAGIRMCGRWQLLSSEPFVTQNVKSILDDFKEAMGQKGISKIYIIEIASICGGTGCGTFIDIPYIVRSSMEQLNLNESLTEFYGFLELPDSKIASTGISGPDKERSRANAYAALKELQYFMGEDAEYRAKFQSSDSEYISKSRIFNQCFLLSNWTIDSDSLKPYNRNPIDKAVKSTYLDGAIPEAINIILSKANEDKGDSSYFGFDSKMSNVNGQGFHKDGNAKPLIASTFGASKIEVPLQEIILAVFNRLFMELSAHWNKLNDTVLISSLSAKIASSFNVNGLYETITEILDFGSLTDAELKDKDFFKELNARLSAVPNDKILSRKNEEFLNRIKNEVDKIYDNYGPFIAAKVLEYDVYWKSVNDGALHLLKEKESEKKDTTFVRQAVDGYNNFGLGLLGLIKQKKKLEIRNELTETLNSYIDTYNVFENILNARRELIETEIHEKIYSRITKMIDKLTDILKTTTGIDSFSFRDKTYNSGGVSEVFSWDFSDVPYEMIHRKIDYMFTKKLSIKEPGNPGLQQKIVYGKLIKMENSVEKEEIFFVPEQKKGITVKTGGEIINNVIAIEEMLRLNGAETQTVNISEQLKKFLNDVKNTQPDDIFNLMLDDFSGIIEAIVKESFKDMIVMYSPKWDFSTPLAGMKDDEKKQIFKTSIEKFKTFALPSFPVSTDKINRLLGKRHFSVTLEPRFDGDYKTLIKEVRDKIITEDHTQTIQRERIPMMITVNFYFDYSLSWYQDLAECKKAYEKLRAAGKTLHLAEGEAEDWSKFDEIELG
jgi:hypothetical protein